MPSIGYGDKYWPNLQSLASEAAGADWAKREAKHLRHLVAAIAACASAPVRVSQRAVDAQEDFEVSFNPATLEYIIMVKRG